MQLEVKTGTQKNIEGEENGKHEGRIGRARDAGEQAGGVESAVCGTSFTFR